MPRRSSGGRSARPAPRPAPARSPPPQTVNVALQSLVAYLKTSKHLLNILKNRFSFHASHLVLDIGFEMQFYVVILNLALLFFKQSLALIHLFFPDAVNHASPPAHAQSSGGGSLLGGIGSTIAQGMAFGTGSAVAHRAVDAVMGPRTIQHETMVSEAAAPSAPAASSMGGAGACNIHSKAFQDCVNNFGNDISKCQFYMDMLTECRKNSGSMLSA
uniref:CHCH domain-containing protein n=1 Tax=Populus davidiana TaxID=266767 RepID=A0A6M2F137_9ROSI